MSQNNYAVIMAGGVGTRLWPFSRTNYPKQFHDILATGQTLLQETAARFDGICPPENIYVVTNDIYYDLVKQQLPFLDDAQILLEPVKRNTAPCIAYASYKIAQQNPQANLVVVPADQVIRETTDFQNVIRVALAETAEKNALVTLGIKPTRPDTGYGYIQFEEAPGQEVKKVKVFTEKPPYEMAVKFVESGEFVWNAGIFVWNVKAILQAFETHLDEVAEVFREAQKNFYTPQEKEAIQKAYSFCKSESIDKGVMEKADNVYVILCDFYWSDLGTWKSLYENSPKDAHQNVVTGKVLTYDTQNSIIKLPKDKLVVVQGLDNVIVAEFDNVLLICSKDQEQRVRDFVNDAKKKGDKYV
ncbi:MAG: mannose-1-phosphate guanylyltransferase [Microscillaceae bacterium]